MSSFDSFSFPSRIVLQRKTKIVVKKYPARNQNDERHMGLAPPCPARGRITPLLAIPLDHLQSKRAGRWCEKSAAQSNGGKTGGGPPTIQQVGFEQREAVIPLSHPYHISRVSIPRLQDDENKTGSQMNGRPVKSKMKTVTPLPVWQQA